MNIFKLVKLLMRCSAIAVTALLSGCMTGEGFHPMNSGILATPGCVITAQDKSFTIVSGQEFQPTFQLGKSAVFGDLGNSMAAPPGDTPRGGVNFYGQALSAGAKRVRVTVPGRAEPLYGVLALFEISDLGTGPGSRSYRIEIPQQYIDEAAGGRTSVVYESYERPGSFYYTVSDYKMPSWALWLSDQPF